MRCVTIPRYAAVSAMHTIKKLGTLFLLSLAIVSVSRAELKLPGIITDHMVLQQNLADPIWGWDTPGTKISVAFAVKVTPPPPARMANGW